MSWFQQPANAAAAIAPHAELTTFVDLDFPSGHVRFHTRTGTVYWGTQSPDHAWLGVGKFGAIDVVREDAELRPNSVVLTLSGVDADLVSAATSELYHGRAVAVYDGYLDTTTFALVAEPELRFRGVMDYMTVTFGRNSGIISLNCESELARWQRPRALLNTHESQQLLYEGDRFFDMIPVLQTRPVDWSKHRHNIPTALRVRAVSGNTIR
jgi:hypothetical protein